jgi:tetratricopeptide (TPR) repeat protein
MLLESLSTTKRIVAMALLSALFLCFIFSLPHRYPDSVLKAKVMARLDAATQDKIENAKLELDEKSAITLNALELTLANSENSGSQKESMIEIIRFWDSKMKPVIAAIYAERLSAAFPDASTWKEAGTRYLYSASMLASEERIWALQRATLCLEKSYELKNNDPETGTALATSIVQTGINPMEGIALLRKVHQEHPDFLPAILQFGHFSVLSGKIPEAINWYNQALALDNTLSEVYFYKGEAYLTGGIKDSAMVAFETYRTLLPDAAALQAFDEWWNEIKHSLIH